jgi:hypothetical protein
MQRSADTYRTVLDWPEKDKGQSEGKTTAIHAAVLKNQGAYAELARAVLATWAIHTQNPSFSLNAWPR